MSQEVSQWLAEIKSLKQQLLELERERDAALESATNWRQLYTTEAQQRRTEAKLAQQNIEALKNQIREIQSLPQLKANNPVAVAAIQEEVAQMQNFEELKIKLAQALIERDSLAKALKAEQENHIHTRKSLTTVIGDTLDRLSKERENRQEESGESIVTALD